MKSRAAPLSLSLALLLGRGAVAGDRAVLESKLEPGHRGLVSFVASSSDGSLIATRGGDGKVWIWDSASGTPLRFIAEEGAVTAVALSPDGTQIATGGRGSSVHLRSLRSSAELVELKGHLGGVAAVEFAGVAERLVTLDASGTVRAWSSLSGDPVGVPFQVPKQEASVLGVSADGEFLVTSGWDGITRLWRLGTGKEVRSFRGHTGAVLGAVVSPGGRRVVTRGGDGVVRVWDCASGKEIQSLGPRPPQSSAPARPAGHKEWVTAVAFTKDGKQYVTGSIDRTALLWDLATHRPIRAFNAGSNVSSLALSQDGKHLVTGSEDGPAHLWDLSTGADLKTLGGPPGRAIAVSPDGRRFARAPEEEGKARVWDLESGREVASCGEGDFVRALAFTPDGRTLAVAGFEFVTLWDVSGQDRTPKSGRRLPNARGFAPQFHSLAMSRDGTLLAASTFDDTVHLWALPEGRSLGSIKTNDGPAGSIAISPDVKTLAIGTINGTVRLWGIATQRWLRDLQKGYPSITSVDFSPDGRLLLVGSGAGTARIWDIGSGREVQPAPDRSDPVIMAYANPDWSRLVTVTRRCATVSSLETGREQGTLCGHAEEIEFSAIDAGGKLLVTGSLDRVVVWDLDRATEISSFEGHTFDGDPQGPVPVVLSADGKVLARAVGEARVRVWNLGSGRALSDLSGATGAVASIASSSEGDRVLTGSNDGIARLWDLRSGGLIRMFKAGETSRVAISPAGGLVATAGKTGGRTTDIEGSTVRLWDAESGKEVRSLRGHSATILALAFSPDGKLIATGSGDRTARIWDVGSGQELHRLEGHRGEVCALAFSPDGTRLATGETYYRARIWDVESGTKLATVEGYPESINAVAFAPQADRLLTAGDAFGVRLWDLPWWTRMLERDTPLRTYGDGREETMYFVATIADGSVIVAGTQSRIELRDGSTGRILESLDSDTSGLRSTAISSDGKRVFMGLGSGVTEIWNVERIVPRPFSPIRGSAAPR